MNDDSTARLRAICLVLPEATEKTAWEHATFRVRDKIFGMEGTAPDGAPALRCKAPPGAQGVLVGGAPDRFFIPAYVGHKGWIGAWLDARADWDEITSLIVDSYRMTAPKRLLARLPGV